MNSGPPLNAFQPIRLILLVLILIFLQWTIFHVKRASRAAWFLLVSRNAGIRAGERLAVSRLKD
jgi:hypothetical protein